MKFKYCLTLTVILIILFSLSTVVASENITGDASLEDALASDVSSVCVGEDLNYSKSQYALDESPVSSDDNVDLSVKIAGENIYSYDKFNRAGYEVPWTVTVEANGGTAKNVKVHVGLSDYLQLLSSNKTIGTFDPTSGIWNIGDLSSGNDASLKLLTKLTHNGRFTVTANATTTSNDVVLSNNNAKLTLKSGTGKKPANTTVTTDTQGGMNSENPGSDPDNPWIVKEPLNSDVKPEETPKKTPENPNPSPDPSPSPDPGPGPDPSPDPSPSPDPDPGPEEEDSDPHIKEISENNFLLESTKSISSAISETFDSISDLLNFGSDRSNSKYNISEDVAKAAFAQDYTKIPILIFAFVLMALVAIVGHDKIKS